MPDLADAAGRAVAVPLAALARLRGGKPMHPAGVVFDGVLERHGPPRPWGVDWIDERTADDVLVRLSRGVGLPAGWPDVLGLAVRIPGGAADGGPVDLLLSSARPGPWSRRLLALRRDAAGAYCSIMSYGSPSGRVQVAVLPEASGVPSGQGALVDEFGRRGLSFTLAVARGREPWVPIGRLRLLAPAEPRDPELAVDAVLHPPPGLTADGPMARFRRPAYAAARAARAAAA